MHQLKSLVFAGAALAATMFVARPAAAASTGPCANLPNPIYLSGSSAMGPLVLAMGGPLSAAATPTTLVYQSAGSCVGVSEILNDTTPSGACATGACIKGTATYYDALGAAQTCDLDANGTHVDIGASDVFATSCSGVTAVPADVKDTTGPIQAMLFVLSRSNPNPQQAITAAEGYFVFGFGGAAGMVTPWLKVAVQFIRNTGSGTQQMTTRGIGIPADKMKGVDAGGSGGVISMLGAQTDEAGIGILSADQYDAHRDSLRSLAFKAFGQWFAYYADSSPTSFDKQNVRDGHYWIWGPIHLLTHINTTTNQPLTAGAKQFLGYITETSTTPPPFDITTVEIAAHVIPQCAMKVQRSTEVGPLSKYDPAAPCGCFFESKVSTSSCTACNLADGMACPGSAGVCRHKFCEAK
jgi:ABC-type phosphate transport system substrate-binding protein